jgi:TrmH family RNA methyltransferase
MSLTKAALQRLRSLREKKIREALGLFVVEGEKVVGELLAAQFPFIELYATHEWEPPVETRVGTGAVAPPSRMNSGKTTSPQPSRSFDGLPAAEAPQFPGANVIRISSEEMARASHFPTPSTVLAVGRIVRPALMPDVLDHGLTLALDGVQDAGNVGTLLRIADWFAFDRVLMSADCADVFHQKVINASMGSFARVPAHTVKLATVLGDLAVRRTRIPILGCDLNGDDVHTLPPLRDAVVVIGSEGRGLSPGVLAHLTRRVTIPRYGRAESLNAAVAAAIVCDTLRRAR